MIWCDLVLVCGLNIVCSCIYAANWGTLSYPRRKFWKNNWLLFFVDVLCCSAGMLVAMMSVKQSNDRSINWYVLLTHMRTYVSSLDCYSNSCLSHITDMCDCYKWNVCVATHQSLLWLLDHCKTKWIKGNRYNSASAMEQRFFEFDAILMGLSRVQGCTSSMTQSTEWVSSSIRCCWDNWM